MPQGGPATLRTVSLPDPSFARNMAAKVVHALAEMNNQYQAMKREQQDARTRHSALVRELDTLELEFDKALQEVIFGQFCSRCKRSASEIERDARETTFEAHLVKVQGHKVDASTRDEAAREIRGRYQPRVDQLRRMRQTEERRITEFEQAMREMREVAPYSQELWRQAVNLEAGIVAARLQLDRDLAKEQVATARTALEELRRQIAALPSSADSNGRRLGELERYAQGALERARKSEADVERSILDRGGAMRVTRSQEFEYVRNVIHLEATSILPNVRIDRTFLEDTNKVVPLYIPSTVRTGQERGGEVVEATWALPTDLIKVPVNISPGVQFWINPRTKDWEVAAFVENLEGARIEIRYSRRQGEHVPTGTITGGVPPTDRTPYWTPIR